MTTNQLYGSHYPRSRTTQKEAVGRSTIEYLVKHDSGNYIHTQENVAQRSRHGLFSQPMGLANGDQYHDAKPDEMLKNVVVNKRLVQRVGPQLFEKMGSPNIGDLYKDKYRKVQLYNKEKADLSIHKNAFQAGGRQKLVKHSEFEHLKQYEDKVYNTKDEQGNVKTGHRNITTNNMRRGYGSTTSGHLFASYKYEPSPYENQLNQQRKQKLQHKAKILKPFVGSSNPQTTFTPHHQTFHLEGEPYQPKNDDIQYRGKSAQKWKYNNPNKKGFYGTFTQYPKYIENGEKQRGAIVHENVWRPNFNGTSKGVGETLGKPCPVGSEMLLNQLRRN